MTTNCDRPHQLQCRCHLSPLLYLQTHLLRCHLLCRRKRTDLRNPFRRGHRPQGPRLLQLPRGLKRCRCPNFWTTICSYQNLKMTQIEVFCYSSFTWYDFLVTDFFACAACQVCERQRARRFKTYLNVNLILKISTSCPLECIEYFSHYLKFFVVISSNKAVQICPNCFILTTQETITQHLF